MGGDLTPTSPLVYATDIIYTYMYISLFNVFIKDL